MSTPTEVPLVTRLRIALGPDVFPAMTEAADVLAAIQQLIDQSLGYDLGYVRISDLDNIFATKGKNR